MPYEPDAAAVWGYRSREYLHRGRQPRADKKKMRGLALAADVSRPLGKVVQHKSEGEEPLPAAQSSAVVGRSHQPRSSPLGPGTMTTFGDKNRFFWVHMSALCSLHLARL